ncbi:MAG: peptidoglycan DD-metalloendopeptidase family protein [Microcoleaceae cyanobacterium]
MKEFKQNQKLNPPLSVDQLASQSPSIIRIGGYLIGGLSACAALFAPAAAFEEFSVPIDSEPYDSSATSVPDVSATGEDYWEPEPSYSEPGYTEPYYEEPAYTEPSYTEPSYSEPYYEAPPLEEYSTDSYDLGTESYEGYSDGYSDSYADDYGAPVESYESYESEPTEPVPLVAPPTEPINLPTESYAQPTPAEIDSPESANLYIDSTDYSIGATEGYTAPSAVIFSDRANGCETVVGLNESVSGLCSAAPQVAGDNGYGGYPPSYSGGIATNGAGHLAAQPNPLYGGGSGSTGYGSVDGSPGLVPVHSLTSYGSNAPGSVPVASLSGNYASSMSLSGEAYYNRTARPIGVKGNGDSSLLFPLTVPAPITSLFGWRQHPVLGYNRFHNGTDIGADEGTPVVATYSGQVSIADWLGGYGLTVILNHEDKAQESLYGHLSELFVKPGETVKQGEVIGRVGNTGMSTGPHLHFELRKLTNQGWVAINPNSHIEFALTKLLNVLQTAGVPSDEFIKALSEKTKNLETGIPKLPPLPPNVDIIVPQLEPPTTDFGFKQNVEPRE